MSAVKQSSDDLKRTRDKGIIDAELALGASELVREWQRALEEFYRDLFFERHRGRTEERENKEGRQ